jgi:hypothetical protein
MERKEEEREHGGVREKKSWRLTGVTSVGVVGLILVRWGGAEAAALALILGLRAERWGQDCRPASVPFNGQPPACYVL